jgi:hypothetical protein
MPGHAQSIPITGFCLRLTSLLYLSLFAFTTLSLGNTIIATGVDGTRGESIWINADGTPQSLYFAGVIFISLSQDGRQYSRDTLCVDLFTDIYLGVAYNNSVLTPNAIPGRSLDRVSWLVDNALLPTQGPIYTSALPSTDWVQSVAQGAGIQLAIWDITHDGGDGFSNGRVQKSTSTTPGQETDPSVLSWATTYETLSAGQSSNLAFVYRNWATDLAGTPAQMLEGPMFTDGGPVPAPEPATCLLAGGALIAIGLCGRRKRGPARLR